MNKKYLIFILYIAFLVVLFEGSARLAFLTPEVSSMLWDHELGWRQSWIRRHQSTGKDIYYKFDVYDPAKGWISKSGLRDVKVFNDKVLNTNSKGFRGKQDYPYGQNKNKIRILILGDSFTFGDEVSDNETYSYYLQEMLPQTEIINLGVHGYGHDQMLILLKEEGIKYEPDIIILGFLPLDMSRNMLGFRDYEKPKFVLNDNKLVLTNTPVSPPEKVIAWDWVRPRVLDLYSVLRLKLMKKLGLYEKEKEAVTTAILEEISQIADSIGAFPVFAFLPSGDEISVDTALTPDEEYFFSMCNAINQVRCFSARPVFAEKLAKGMAFKQAGHWRPEGHLAVAESIKRNLVDEGLVPVSPVSTSDPVEFH